MKIEFTCRSCGAAGAADAAFAGRGVRCKHCGYRFTIPRAGEVDSEVYRLQEPVAAVPEVVATSLDEESAFVRSHGNPPAVGERPRKSKRSATSSPTPPARPRVPRPAWLPWLLGAVVLIAAVLGVVALAVPRGMIIVGSILAIGGMLMVLVGWGAGAYGAFGEDLIYGILYVFLPLYTAYYMVTRWEDLWAWFLCSTAGAVLVTIGTGLLQRAL